MSGRGLLPSPDQDKLGPQKDKDDEDEDEDPQDRLGQWIRRRCLDGALNRARKFSKRYDNLQISNSKFKTFSYLRCFSAI